MNLYTDKKQGKWIRANWSNITPVAFTIKNSFYRSYHHSSPTLTSRLLKQYRRRLKYYPKNQKLKPILYLLKNANGVANISNHLTEMKNIILENAKMKHAGKPIEDEPGITIKKIKRKKI